MPTIFDVAREAGVSTAAVSLVLNDPDTNRVGKEKRKHILRIAERIGYTPNILAKGLAKRRTRVIGLVVPMHDPIFFNHFIAGVLAGIQSCLMERGYHLMVYSHTARTGRFTRSLLGTASFVDGILLFNTRMCTDADMNASIHELRAAQMPFVMISGYYGHEPIHSVGVDDREIGYHAGQYLAGRGHRQVTMLMGSHRPPSSAQLQVGFTEALGEARLPPALHDFSEYDDQRIARIVSAWLKRKRPPTAIFCADDQMAAGVLDAIRAQGKRIPEDVAVLGRGDLTVCTYLTPKLTTIRIPTVEMGRRAAELLTDALEGKADTPQRILLPTPLVVRDSA